MIETILLSFIVAKIKGYKISNIFKNRTIYPVIIMEIVIWCCQMMIFRGNYSIIQITSIIKPLYLCSYFGLIIKYELYGQALLGSVFIFIGGFLNDLAIKFNGGYMPVYPSLSYMTGYVKSNTFNVANDIHILGTSSTRLKILTDYIDLGYSVLSIGDVLIRGFAFLIIYNAVKLSNKSDIKEIVEC